MPHSTITAKGQTTIPQEIRDLFHLKPGDRLDYHVRGNQVFLLAKNRDIRDLYGALREYANTPPLSLEEEQRHMEEAVARDVLRSLEP